MSSIYEGCDVLEALLHAQDQEDQLYRNNGVENLDNENNLNVSAHSSGDDDEICSLSDDDAGRIIRLSDNSVSKRSSLFYDLYDYKSFIPASEMLKTAELLRDRFYTCSESKNFAAVKGIQKIRRRYDKEVELALDAKNRESRLFEDGVDERNIKERQLYQKCNGLLCLEILLACLENERGIISIGHSEMLSEEALMEGSSDEENDPFMECFHPTRAGKSAPRPSVDIDIICDFGYKWIKVKGAAIRNLSDDFQGVTRRKPFVRTVTNIVNAARVHRMPFGRNPEVLVLLFQLPEDENEDIEDTNTLVTMEGIDEETNGMLSMRKVVLDTMFLNAKVDLVDWYLNSHLCEELLEERKISKISDVEKSAQYKGYTDVFQLHSCVSTLARLEAAKRSWQYRSPITIAEYMDCYQRSLGLLGGRKEESSDCNTPPLLTHNATNLTDDIPVLINFDVTALVALCSDTCHGFAKNTRLPQYPVLNGQLENEVMNRALVDHIYLHLDQYTVKGAPRWWRYTHTTMSNIEGEPSHTSPAAYNASWWMSLREYELMNDTNANAARSPTSQHGYVCCGELFLSSQLPDNSDSSSINYKENACNDRNAKEQDDIRALSGSYKMEYPVTHNQLVRATKHNIVQNALHMEKNSSLRRSHRNKPVNPVNSTCTGELSDYVVLARLKNMMDKKNGVDIQTIKSYDCDTSDKTLSHSIVTELQDAVDLWTEEEHLQEQMIDNICGWVPLYDTKLLQASSSRNSTGGDEILPEGSTSSTPSMCNGTSSNDIKAAEPDPASYVKVGRYNWIVSDVAFTEFKWIIVTIASPSEKMRAEFLMNFLHIVPTKRLVEVELDPEILTVNITSPDLRNIISDQQPPVVPFSNMESVEEFSLSSKNWPRFTSGRNKNPCWFGSQAPSLVSSVQTSPVEVEGPYTIPPPYHPMPFPISYVVNSINVTTKIKPRHLAVFGLGDAVRAITLTANEQFIRGALEQRQTICVGLHPSRALTGGKIIEKAGCLSDKRCETNKHRVRRTRHVSMATSGH